MIDPILGHLFFFKSIYLCSHDNFNSTTPSQTLVLIKKKKNYGLIFEMFAFKVLKFWKELQNANYNFATNLISVPIHANKVN